MKKITNAEIIAVAEGTADRVTQRRVLAASLQDGAVRRRLVLLESLATVQDPLPARSLTQQQALHDALLDAARRVGREYRESSTLALPPWLQELGSRVRQVLSLESHTFRLPALAPALAASAPTLRVQREVLELQGIRLEVHQLPDTPPRLRFVVDAGASSDFLSEEVTGVALALQEDGNLELQILVVPINSQGRGVLELMPPETRGIVSLLGVALVTG